MHVPFKKTFYMTKVIQARRQKTENIYLQLTSQARVHLPNILKAPKNLEERHQKPNRKMGEGYDHKAHREKKYKWSLNIYKCAQPQP